MCLTCSSQCRFVLTYTQLRSVATQSLNVLTLRECIWGKRFGTTAYIVHFCACMHTCEVTPLEHVWLHYVAHMCALYQAKLVFECVWLVLSTGIYDLYFHAGATAILMHV